MSLQATGDHTTMKACWCIAAAAGRTVSRRQPRHASHVLQFAIVPHNWLRAKRKGYGCCRNPFCFNVPKRGLEPPLPKREPGPEPGASANSATSAKVVFPEEHILCVLPEIYGPQSVKSRLRLRALRRSAVQPLSPGPHRLYYRNNLPARVAKTAVRAPKAIETSRQPA